MASYLDPVEGEDLSCEAVIEFTKMNGAPAAVFCNRPAKMRGFTLWCDLHWDIMNARWLEKAKEATSEP